MQNIAMCIFIQFDGSNACFVHFLPRTIETSVCVCGGRFNTHTVVPLPAQKGTGFKSQPQHDTWERFKSQMPNLRPAHE